MTIDKTHQLSQALLSYLRQNGKSKLPSTFIKDIEERLSGSKSESESVLTSAVALSKADRALVEAYVKKHAGHTRIKYRLDPALIAGFTLKTGDNLLDASLLTKLSQLQMELRTL